MPRLIVKNPDTGRAVDYQLNREITRIGRAVDRNDIVLHDGQVSREHAIVKRTATGFVFVDLNSANGTYFAGERVSEHNIKDRDSFTLGKYTIEYRDQTGMLSIKYESNPVGGGAYVYDGAQSFGRPYLNSVGGQLAASQIVSSYGSDLVGIYPMINALAVA